MKTSVTKVINHYVRKTDKKIYKITTISGREIVATDDHKFMTSNGWCEVRNMEINKTKIGILAHQNNIIENHIIENKCILSEDKFIDFFIERGFTMRLIQKYVDEL